jgi:hypothetical protein
MTEHIKDQGKIILRYSTEIDKGDPNAIWDLLSESHRKYWNTYFFADGRNRRPINLPKFKFGESLNWKPSDVSPDIKKVCPINFHTEHKEMLSQLHVMES